MRQNYYHEKAIVRKLVAQALSDNMQLAVDDGIELTDSQDFDTIWGIVDSVEESVIRMKHDNGNYCGYVLLISGLGNEIVADNSFFCEKHITEASALSDKLSNI